MPRLGADVGEAELLQKRPDIPLMEVDVEPLGDDTLEIDTPPAHDAIFLAVWASLDDSGDLGHLLGRQTRLRAFGPVVERPVRTQGVEAVNPVAKRLAVLPPIFEAAPRSNPSRTPANDRSRRLWLTSFDPRASLRRSAAE